MAKVLVSMRDKFLNEINQYAEKDSRTRSELIREALRFYLRKAQIFDQNKAENNAQLLTSLLS